MLPVVRAIVKGRPETILSVDTYHASTAQLALESGAEIINDVSGLLWDPAMSTVLEREKPGAILMHTRGAPRVWNTLPSLPRADIMPLVVSGLAHTVQLARAAGIDDASLVLDPGFGFGKRGDENFTLLAHLADLHQFGLPLLVGTSHKRFLSAHLPAPAENTRRHATSASHVAAMLAGVHLLRVHDVADARAAASIADAVLSSFYPGETADHPSGVRQKF